MNEFSQKRLLKYLFYLTGFILFIIVNITWDLIHKLQAYGKMMLITVGVIILGQIFFAIRQLKFNWFTTIIYQVVITTITFYVTNFLLRAIVPLKGISYRQEETIMTFLYFVSFIGLTELMWEIANKYYK